VLLPQIRSTRRLGREFSQFCRSTAEILAIRTLLDEQLADSRRTSYTTVLQILPEKIGLVGRQHNEIKRGEDRNGQ
jgi:hypothetical protein